MIENLYRRYEQLVTTGDNQERLRVKADIARLISRGEGQWYIDNLYQSIAAIQTPQQELRFFFDKENRYLPREEASLAESVYATHELNKHYESLKKLLLPNIRTMVKIGSSTWAENFNVRCNPANPSDLDLEVLIDTIDPSIGEGLPGAPEGLETFRRYYEAGEADYFSYGFKKDIWPISIHFMPTAVFRRNCGVDCQNLTTSTMNREFRMKPKSKAPIYDERYDAQGNEYVFEGKPVLYEGGMITTVPVMMVGERNQIIMGLVMSKYFTFPKVDGDKEFFEAAILNFKRSLAERIHIDGGTFANMPARKNRMPYYILDQLREQQDMLTHLTGKKVVYA